MKKLNYILFMACIASSALMPAKATEIIIDNAKMTRVELYTNGAQVYKQFSFTSNNRVTLLRITGIPSDIDPKTIRAKALGKQKIVSIHFETDYSMSKAKISRTEALKDSLEQNSLDQQLIVAEQQAIESQLLLINRNLEVLQNDRGVEELQKLLNLQRNEIGSMRKQLVLLAKKLAIEKEIENTLRRKFTLSNNHENDLAGVAILEILAEPNVKHQIELSYLVADAWWNPIYDIRVENINEALELEYRAEVYQNSKEDWNDVKLMLFSNNPQLDGELGELKPWDLKFNSSAPVYSRNSNATTPISQMASDQTGISGIILEKGNGMPIPFANVVLKSDNRMIAGAQTDFEGRFSIINIVPGIYDLEATTVGFYPVKISSIKLNARSMSNVDISMVVSTQLLELVNISYNQSLIQQDAASTSTRVTTRELSKMPARSAAEMASSVGGTYSRDFGSSVNIRGGRDDANYYYIDGIKVRGSSALNDRYSYERVYSTLFLDDQNQQEELRVEFEAPGNQTIPSSDKMKRVYLKSREVQANYVYRAIPRIDNKVYLYAEIVNWSDLGLLTGKTNLFYSNIFVGESKINADQTNDTLSISLGPDRNILLSSERTDNTEKLGLINSNTIDQSFKIELKSLKSYPVKIRLEDQIPVAKDKSFSVEITENADGSLAEKTGILTWEFTLEAQAKAVKTYTYQLKHPKSVRIALAENH